MCIKTSAARRFATTPPSAVPERSGCALRTLGGFEVVLNGKPVAWPPLRPRARALLLLLAIHQGKDLHRERLIDALWPDAPADAGPHRLQVAASNVRQSLAAVGLGDQAVQRNGDAYRLVLPGAWVDLTFYWPQAARWEGVDFRVGLE